MNTVKNIYDYIDAFAPFDTQCEWDNSGLLVGNKEKEVKKALVCLDLTFDALDLAKNQGCDLVITHHPVIFSALKDVSFDGIVAKLCKAEISVISAHTNFDCADGGVNDILCNVLELSNVTAFGEDNLARAGKLKNPLTDREFVSYISQKLNCKAVKYTSTGKKIQKVAVCGGAGADYMNDALSIGADALVTSDTKHHQHLFAKEKAFCLVDAGHYNTENPAIFILTEKLRKEFKDIEFTVFEGEDPIEYIK